MTWADIAVADCFGCGFLPDYYKELSASPVIAKHVEKICNLPNIKSWIEKRPKDNM